MDNMYLRNLTELFFKENEEIFLANPHTRVVVGADRAGNPKYKVACPQHYKCLLGQKMYQFYEIMHKIDKLMDKFKIPFVKIIRPHDLFETPHLEYILENNELEPCVLFSVVILDNNFNIRTAANNLKRDRFNKPILDDKSLSTNDKIVLNTMRGSSFVNSMETQVYSKLTAILDYKDDSFDCYFEAEDFEKEFDRIWKRLIDKNTNKVKQRTLNRIIKSLY